MVGMKLDWNKAFIYAVVFIFLWFALLNQANVMFFISVNGTDIHIHHSIIGIVILFSAYIFDKVTKKRYEWLTEVLIAVGISLIIHHIITEGVA